jgi:hypothetical protein
VRAVLIPVVLLLVAACGGSETEPRTASVSSPAAALKSVVGLSWTGDQARLGRLDPLTLKPEGPQVEVAGAFAPAVSPDGRTLVLASSVTTGPAGTSEQAELIFVDTTTLRPARHIKLPEPGWVSHVLWARPDRLVVLVGGDPIHLVTLDPRSARVLGSQAVPGRLTAADMAGGKLSVLLSPASSIGPSRLVVVAADGSLRTVALREILSGWEAVEDAEDAFASRQRSPGLAVSPDGTRALVVPAGGRVAAVDLDSLTVSYHDLAEPVSFLERLRGWLDPAAEAKIVDGPARFARWLDERRVAVTGMDYHGLAEEEDGPQATPAGLRVIDTGDWSVSTLHDEVTDILVAGDLLLAFGGPYAHSSGSQGVGLRAYTADGDERFHLFRDELVGWVDVAWPYGYVHRAAAPIAVVDLRAGRVVARPDPVGDVSIVRATR